MQQDLFEHREEPIVPRAEPGAQFDGATYNPKNDRVRLSGQLRTMWNIIVDLEVHSVREIGERTGFPEPSISAQFRNLRKEKFGGWYIPRITLDDKRGHYAYQLVLRPGETVDRVELVDKPTRRPKS